MISAEFIRNAGRALMDVCFPRACAGCGGPAGRDFLYLCGDCRAQLDFIQPPFCRRCGDPVDGMVTDVFDCAVCFHRPRYFDCARSAVRYRGILQTVLQDFKYRGATWLSRDLGVFLKAAFDTAWPAADIDGVTFVPLHAVRERERSYNQAQLLARELAAQLADVPLRAVLRRIQPTPTQTHLTAAERTANVKNKFVMAQDCSVQNQRLLLVDDVMTTGATVNECARVLKSAGAAIVLVLTVARG